jgi:hypothetical protein
VGNRLWRSKFRAFVVVATGVTLAACSSTPSSTSSTATSSSGKSGSAVPIGTAIPYDAGGLKETVTLVQVVNPATEATYANSPPPASGNQKYVGIMFKVRNDGEKSAVVQLTEQLLLEYSSGVHDSADEALLSDCPPFGGSAAAIAQIPAGQSTSGCVTFEAQKNVALAQVLLTSPDKTFGAWSLTKSLLPIFPG